MSLRALFALQPFQKILENFHQNLGMSCDVSTSLLCKNIFWPLEILSSTPIFPIWSSRHFCTATHLNISSKILPSVWRWQWMHTIHLQAKTQWCFFEKFEWINLFCILVQFGDLYCNHIFPCSSDPELSPTCSPPYQTLKSRRLGSLEVL